MSNSSKVIVQYWNQYMDSWMNFQEVGPVDHHFAMSEVKKFFPNDKVRIIHRVVDEKVLVSD